MRFDATLWRLVKGHVTFDGVTQRAPRRSPALSDTRGKFRESGHPGVQGSLAGLLAALNPGRCIGRSFHWRLCAALRAGSVVLAGGL